MRVLVTGGAGFIGSHLTERLLAEHHRVSILDDFNNFYDPELKRRNLSAVAGHPRLQVSVGDIRDNSFVTPLFESLRPDAIVHLAARAGVRPSVMDPLLYESVNVGGTTVLLEAARRTGVRKFVFASSSSVYGLGDNVASNESVTPPRPISPYAATKIAGEHLCHVYAHLYGLQIVCLRLFTVYGPRQRPDLAIRKFTDMVLRGEPIPMYGDGSSARDYTYVDDTVDGIARALAHECAYDIYNLGNSHPVSLREMIDRIAANAGREAVLEQLPPQSGDAWITHADISKARRDLGYSPRISFEEGIRRFVAWYRSSGAIAATASVP